MIVVRNRFSSSSRGGSPLKSRTLHRLGLAAALAPAGRLRQRTSARWWPKRPGCLSNVAVDRPLADYNARRPAANPPGR